MKKEEDIEKMKEDLKQAEFTKLSSIPTNEDWRILKIIGIQNQTMLIRFRKMMECLK